MFESLTKMATKAGLWTEEPVASEVVTKVDVPVPTAAVQSFGYLSSNPASVNEDLYNAISIAIGTGVDNNLSKLSMMSETMRTAIPDEAMRMKAAAAATGLTAVQVITSIDTLIANVAIEKNRFLDTDIRALTIEVRVLTAENEDTKRKIEDLTKALQETIALCDQERVELAQKSQNIQNVMSVFEATSAKVLQDLDMEKKKIGIYIS